jgi:hypothetical protein
MSHNMRLIILIEDVDRKLRVSTDGMAWTGSIGLGFPVARAMTESEGLMLERNRNEK